MSRPYSESGLTYREVGQRCAEWAAVAALGFTILLLPFAFGGHYPGWLTLAEVFTFAAVAVLGSLGVYEFRGIGARRLSASLAVLALAAGLSAAFSPAPATSYPGLVEWLWLGGTGVLAVSLTRRLRGRKVLVGMLLGAVIGEVFWAYYLWWGSRTPTHPQFGTFYAPNQYAGYVVLLAPLLLGVCLTAKSRWSAAGAGTAAGFLYLGVALSGSRAGVAAALLGMLAAALFSRQPLGRVALRTGFVVVAVVGLGFLMTSSLLFPGAAHRATAGAQGALGVKGTDPASLVMRVRWDRAAFGMGLHHLLTGTGLGTFGAVLLKTANPSWQWSAFAHNQFLESFAEGGALMFAGMLGLVLVPMTVGARALWARRSDPDGWCLGLWAGLVGASAHLLLDHDWSYPAYAAAFVVAAALVTAPWDSLAEQPAPVRAGWFRPSLAGVAGLCLLVSAGSYVSGRLVQGRAPSTGSIHAAMVLAPYASAPYVKRADRLASSASPTDLAAAARALGSAAARDPYDPALQWDLAGVETRLGNHQAARQAYRQAISIVPGSPKAYILAATFEATVDHKPTVAAALLDEGIARLRRGAQGESPAPGLIGLFGARAQVEDQLRGPKAALPFAQEAVAVGPNFPQAWSELRSVACQAGAAEIVAQASERLVALGAPSPGPCPA